MLAQDQSSSAKRGRLAADVSSGLIFLKKKKKERKRKKENEEIRSIGEWLSNLWYSHSMNYDKPLKN